MPRKTVKSLQIIPTVRALQIYPVENSRKPISDLKTVGLTLSNDQAHHLALVLLMMSARYDKIDITGWRLERRQSDGTQKVTVTAFKD